MARKINFMTVAFLGVVAWVVAFLHRLGLEPTFIDWFVTTNIERHLEKRAAIS